MEANIRLASGRRIHFDTPIPRTVSDARRKIARVLGVPPDSIRFVTATSAQPYEWDPFSVLCDGPVTVVILHDRVQREIELRFVKACSHRFTYGRLCI